MRSLCTLFCVHPLQRQTVLNVTAVWTCSVWWEFLLDLAFNLLLIYRDLFVSTIQFVVIYQRFLIYFLLFVQWAPCFCTCFVVKDQVCGIDVDVCVLRADGCGVFCVLNCKKLELWWPRTWTVLQCCEDTVQTADALINQGQSLASDNGASFFLLVVISCFATCCVHCEREMESSTERCVRGGFVRLINVKSRKC